MNDLISRQAAIDALGERPMVWTDDNQYTLGERNQYDRDRLAIGTLPSAEVTLCHLDSPCEYQNADIAMPSAQPEQRYTKEELMVFRHGISLSLLSKRSAQHWQYDKDTATEIEFLERLYEKVGADIRGEEK